jgi:branched-subunit amino acid aminotransferase/4-amino-4-deoxychorismate lyase
VATEVFITSSTTGVVPVNRIDDQPFAINGPATIRARAHIDNLQKIHSSSAQ